MNGGRMNEPIKKRDWTDKVFPIGVDAPLKITLNRDTGALSIQQTQLHPAVKGGITMALLLSPAATRELVLALKRLETELGKPIEDLSMPDTVQKHCENTSELQSPDHLVCR